MKSIVFKYLGLGLIISIASFSVQAELLDQYPVTNSEFANAYKRGTTSASVNLYIDGVGINRKVTIAHSVYSYSLGINSYWRGVISTDNVTVNGIGQITVSTNTCAYLPDRTWGVDACGQVDVVFNKGDFLWRTNGNIQYNWDPLVVSINGGTTTFAAEVTGFVKGVDMSGAFRPAMGIYTNADVVVEIPDAAI